MVIVAILGVVLAAACSVAGYAYGQMKAMQAANTRAEKRDDGGKAQREFLKLVRELQADFVRGYEQSTAALADLAAKVFGTGASATVEGTSSAPAVEAAGADAEPTQYPLHEFDRFLAGDIQEGMDVPGYVRPPQVVEQL